MFERTKLVVKLAVGIVALPFIIPIIILYKKTKLKMKSLITLKDVEEDTQDD